MSKKVPNFQGIFLIIFLLEKYQLRRSFFVRSFFLICNSLIVKRSPFLMTLHYINSRSTIGFYKNIGFRPKIYLIIYASFENLTTHITILMIIINHFCASLVVQSIISCLIFLRHGEWMLYPCMLISTLWSNVVKNRPIAKGQ